MSLINIIIIVLVVMWLLGFGIHIGGSLIHLILVVAVLVWLFDYFQGHGGRPAA
jgi:Family of unknown function (DUF5670)